MAGGTPSPAADAAAPPRARRYSVQPDGPQRLRASLTELIDANARRGERLLLYGRFVILVVALVDLVMGNLRSDLPGAHLAYVVTALGLATLTYAGLLVALHRVRPCYPVLLVSVLVDQIVIFAMLLPSLRWPDATYFGVLRMSELGLVLVAIAAAGLRLHRRLASLSATLALASIGALVGLDVAWNGARIVWGITDVLGVTVLFVASSVIGLVVSHRTKRMVFEAARLAAKTERARERLRVYVSEDVASEALDGSEDQLSLDGKQRHVAVLFSDLRDFTRYANSIDPRQLVAELNGYFDAMVPVIQQHGGTIDKFMGDSIMAVFTAGGDGRPAAARALAAALAMKDALARHNQDRLAAGRPPLRHGIGLHAGLVVAGNVGTQDRVQFTIIGDVVNVASRLEKATKEHGRWLLCSAAAWQDAREAAPEVVAGLEPLGPVELRGVDGAIAIYAPPAEPAAA